MTNSGAEKARLCRARFAVCRHFRSAAPAYFDLPPVARGKRLTIGIAIPPLFAFPPPKKNCHTQRVPPHKTSGCTAPSTRKAYSDLPPVAWRKRPTIGLNIPYVTRTKTLPAAAPQLRRDPPPSAPPPLGWLLRRGSDATPVVAPSCLGSRRVRWLSPDYRDSDSKVSPFHPVQTDSPGMQIPGEFRISAPIRQPGRP